MSIESPIKEKPKVAEVLAEAGLEVERIAPRILERLELLNKVTGIVEEGRHSIRIARSIFQHYETSRIEQAFNDLEKRIVIVGSIFSDIGKTGPRMATPEQQRLIVEMFGIDNVQDPNMKVSDFLALYFPNDSEERIERFKSLELNPNMTMREFWNLHSFWTLEIISGDGVPLEAIAGAASHHMIEGINPANVLPGNGKFAKYFGENPTFDRAEKLIILLDKFDAFRHRGGKRDQEAVELLKAVIARNPMFTEDEEFRVLLQDFEELFSK